MTDPVYRVAMASVYATNDDIPFVVTQSPSEIASLATDNPDGLIELTLANRDEWNGKPCYVRSSYIVAITPPKNMDD